MSFILDALKKSENERQRQIGPSLADIPVRRARSDRPWWAVAVAALLVVNLGVLLVVLLRDHDSASTSAPQATTAAPPQTMPSDAGAQERTREQLVPTPRVNTPPIDAMSAPPRTNPAVQSLAEAAGAETDLMAEEVPYDPSMAGAAAVPEGPPVVRSIAPPTVAPLPNGATFAAQDRAGSAPPADEMLPTHASLVASGSNLPEMRLDIHVYSPNPKERFVFVNMRKYVEGQTLTEGPVLERITADGAVLNQNGTRFLLPRQ